MATLQHTVRKVHKNRKPTAIPQHLDSSEVVLETKVLVSRRLEDKQ